MSHDAVNAEYSPKECPAKKLYLIIEITSVSYSVSITLKY